jgi:hypothetical protein
MHSICGALEKVVAIRLGFKKSFLSSRARNVQTSLAINWPCAAGIDVVSLDRRTPANEKKG